ncbi:MAG: hypothetical protein U5K27_16835 [Desulfotignum sp.]|nr:hypothetical protein [Desulfotignum sp.]
MREPQIIEAQAAKIRQFFNPNTIAIATGNISKSAAMPSKIPHQTGLFFVAVRTATDIRKKGMALTWLNGRFFIKETISEENESIYKKVRSEASPSCKAMAILSKIHQNIDEYYY